MVRLIINMAIEFSIEFPLRVVVYPAPDMPGTWIAHGLETDIVTQATAQPQSRHAKRVILVVLLRIKREIAGF